MEEKIEESLEMLEEEIAYREADIKEKDKYIEIQVGLLKHYKALRKNSLAIISECKKKTAKIKKGVKLLGMEKVLEEHSKYKPGGEGQINAQNSFEGLRRSTRKRKNSKPLK